jgi:hypothetical protein
MSRRRVTVLLPLLAAVVACQDPDVGSRCRITWGDGPPPTPQTIRGDYLETGNVACEDLVCIVSPAAADSRSQYASCAGGDEATGDAGSCGYCSKPCVSDSDCYKDETGLECRQMVLDPDFIAALPEEIRQKYLGDAAFSSYCAVPD